MSAFTSHPYGSDQRVPVLDVMDERIRAAVAGDRSAAHELLAELLPRVRNLVAYLIRGDSEIDDVAQEALVAVLRGLGTFRGDGAFESWVDRIVARATFSYVGKRRQAMERQRVEEESSVIDDETAPDEYVARRRAVAVLNEISFEQRQVLVLHHVVEMNVREIAREVGIPMETVRSRLRLARARLRSLGMAGADNDEGDGPKSGGENHDDG